jgi:hypothetical protein
MKLIIFPATSAGLPVQQTIWQAGSWEDSIKQ